MKNFKHSSESAVQSKQGRFFPPLPDPGEECVIVCVFICPGTRPAVDQSCVCGSGGDPWSRAGQGRCWKPGAGRWPFAECLGVSTGRGKGRTSVFAQSYYIDILLCQSACKGDRGAV